MKDEVIFLTSLITPNDKEKDAIEEYVNSSLIYDDIDELHDNINMLENDMDIDPYNYEITKKEMYHSLSIINIVESYKIRVLTNKEIKELFDMNFLI